MKIKVYFCSALIILTALVLSSCSNKAEISLNIPARHSQLNSIIDSCNFIIENSGSMEGYLNGLKFRKDITDFNAELDRIKSNKDSTLFIKDIFYYTFSDNTNLTRFANNSMDFNSKINNKKIAIGKTSPLDELLKRLIDSSASTKIDIIVSDFVIDDNSKNAIPTLQAKINLIFNSAKQKNIGLLIYRLTSDFDGTHFPVLGGARHIKGITRPYFIWIIGPVESLSLLREKLASSNVFHPENDISFGIPLLPLKNDVMIHSNRIGQWKYSHMKFQKIKMKDNQLRFTIAFDFKYLPTHLQNIDSLTNSINVMSQTMDIDTSKFVSKVELAKSVKDKDNQRFKDNTHFLEITISRINSLTNELHLSFHNKIPNWVSQYSTDDDRLLTNSNNLKTFALKNIIAGIDNAYNH